MKNAPPTRRIRPATAVVLFALLGLGASAQPASARNRGEIRFAAGASSKTVSGTTRASNPDCWNFGADEGQRVSFRVTGTAVVGLFVFENDPFYDDPASNSAFQKFGARTDSQTIGEGGPYRVCVNVTSKASRTYKLTLTIV